MIDMPIEQEIEREHVALRIGAKKLNYRQAIFGGIIAGLTILAYILTKDIISTLILISPLASILCYFGWKNDHGLKGEDIFVMKLTKFFYKNTMRKFRSRNSYYDMYNKVYSKMRNKDMSDKRVERLLKKRDKELKMRLKHSKVKAII